jgi:KDO2-lipid IV(A) lauroyltransferase
MAVKARSLVADYAVYLLARLAVCVLQALPWSWLLGLADLLAWLAYRVDRRHREVARDNLRQAFPEKNPAEIESLVYASYRHLLWVLVEMIRLPRELHAHNAMSRVAFADPAILHRAERWLATGRPLVVITGHLGNWEALSYAMGLLGYRGHVIARRLDNPFLDRYVKRLRIRTGQALLDKNQDFEQIVSILESGGHIAALADQDAGARGEFVRFFGRPASTFKSLALLSLRYEAPIIVLGAVRLAPGLHFRAYLEDEIEPRDYADHPHAVHAITQRFTAALEAMVRRHPEQYFWLHRRWKHQPRQRSPQRNVA